MTCTSTSIGITVLPARLTWVAPGGTFNASLGPSCTILPERTINAAFSMEAPHLPKSAALPRMPPHPNLAATPLRRHSYAYGHEKQRRCRQTGTSDNPSAITCKSHLDSLLPKLHSSFPRQEVYRTCPETTGPSILQVLGIPNFDDDPASVDTGGDANVIRERYARGSERG